MEAGNFTKKYPNINSILAVINGLQCEDEIETLIGTNLGCLHVLIMDFMKRAYHADNTFEGRDANVTRVCKLVRAFNSQMETLVKYRNRGTQKVTVEHVNVNEGGQAVFGNVNTKKGGGC